MNDVTLALVVWLARTLVAGGCVLAIGWFIARRLRPADARMVGGWSVRAAVLAGLLSTMPGWITLPAPACLVKSPNSVPKSPNVELVIPQSPNSITDNLIADVRNDSGFWELVKIPVDVMVEHEDGLPPQNVTFVSTPNVIETPEQPEAVEIIVENVEHSLLIDVARIVLIAYGIGVTIALGQLLLAQFAVSRIVLAASKAPGRVQERFAAACERSGVSARLLLSSRVTSPVCFGVLRPTVVLPKSFAQTAYDTELNWVFAHELEHLARGDHRLVWWVGVARALFFVVPAFWAIRRQLGLAQEYLADAAAAAVGHAAEYAEFLVSLSTGPSQVWAVRHPLTATGVKAGRSDLYRRVTMLVSNSTEASRRPSRHWRILAAGGTLSAVILMSGFGIASEPSKPVEANTAAVLDSTASAAPDDQQDKKAAEAKVRADELKAKAEKARAEAEQAMRVADKARAEADMARDAARSADRKVETFRVTGRAVVDEKAIAEVKKEIMEAAKKGDMKAVEAATDKLAKLSSSSPRNVILRADAPARIEGRMIEPPVDPARASDVPRGDRAIERPKAPKPPLPPDAAEVAPPAPAAPPRVARNFVLPLPHGDSAKAYERGMQQFKQAIERVKDNPEAKAEIEKAMKAFEKAMKDVESAMPNVMEFQFRDAMPAVEWKAPQIAPMKGGMTFNATGGEGRLGIVIEEVPAETVEKLGLTKGVGVVVKEVRDGTPAAKAGIKKDDIVLEFAGKPVPGEPGDVVKLIGQVKKDDKVTIIVLRKGEKKEIKDVTLPEAKATKVRVLEAIPGGDFPVPVPVQGFELPLAQLQKLEKLNGLGLDPAQLQKELARVQQEIEKLNGEGGMTGKKSSSMSVMVNNDDYTIKAEQDGVTFDITGSKDGGISSIKIKDGDKTIKASEISELPENYRKTVEKLMKSVKIGKE